MCLNEVISSFHLFRETTSKLQIMKYFSESHMLHRFEAGSYGAAYFKLFQVILNLDCQSLLKDYRARCPI